MLSLADESLYLGVVIMSVSPGYRHGTSTIPEAGLLWQIKVASPGLSDR